jgi:thioredoxin-related protein
VRLNVIEQDSRPLAARLGVRAVPTYVLLDGEGREVWRQVGSINAAAARRALADVVGER